MKWMVWYSRRIFSWQYSPDPPSIGPVTCHSRSQEQRRNRFIEKEVIVNELLLFSFCHILQSIVLPTEVPFQAGQSWRQNREACSTEIVLNELFDRMQPCAYSGLPFINAKTAKRVVSVRQLHGMLTFNNYLQQSKELAVFHSPEVGTPFTQCTCFFAAALNNMQLMGYS